MYWFYVVLLLGTVYCTYAQIEEDDPDPVLILNEEIDKLLVQIRSQLVESNQTHASLPDISLSYSKKILFFTGTGELNGTEGWIEDLSSVQRTSNITLTAGDVSMVAKLEFGFNDLRIGYMYRAKFMRIPVGGSLEVLINNNSIALELSVNVSKDRCSGDVNVDSVKFTILKGIQAKITGFGIFNGIISRLISRSLEDLNSTVKSTIEESLTTYFRENIKQFNLCKFGTVPEESALLKSSTDGEGTTETSNATVPNFINAILKQNFDEDKTQ